MTGVDVTDPRPGHEFDVERLCDYLARNLGGFRAPLRVQQFRGGQSNPTFLLETGNARYVMRKKPRGDLLPSAHMVEREYQVTRALSETDVPVIRPQVAETTALGAAYAAGLATGFWSNLEDLRQNWQVDHTWEPKMAEADREAQYKMWKKAVTRTFDWVE